MSISVFVGNHSSINDYNVSNGNWARMNEFLGTDLDHCGQMSGIGLETFRETILAGITKAIETEADEGLPVVQDGNWIDCGLRNGYWRDRLPMLLDVVDHAIELNAPLCWA